MKLNNNLKRKYLIKCNLVSNYALNNYTFYRIIMPLTFIPLNIAGVILELFFYDPFILL